MNEKEIVEFRKKHIRPLDQGQKFEIPTEKPAIPTVMQKIIEEQGGNGIPDADVTNQT